MAQPTTFVWGPLSSAACLGRGLAMLAQPSLRRFVWLPLLLNLLLYAVAAWLGAHYFAQAMEVLVPTWLEWLRWLLWPLFAGAFILFAAFSVTVVANLVAAPFFAPLAERALLLLGLELPTPAPVGLLRGIGTEIGGELGRLRYFGLRALPLLLVSLLPGVNVLAPLLWLLFSVWSLSLEYLAYPLAALGLDFDRQRAVARARRIETLAFGAAVLFCLGIPLLNIFIPPAAVIGAAIYVAERRQLLNRREDDALSVRR